MSKFRSNYFICEIGVNHEGSLENAERMIEQIATNGGHAAKFQTYKAEKLAIKDSQAYWDTDKEATKSQFELFKKFDGFGKSEYQKLAECCKLHGIDFLSTPFDLDCLEWLLPLMPCVKIASADLTNYMLLEAVASFKKPVILSVGASSFLEITESVELLLSRGATEVCILHCMLLYPTPIEYSFLGRIKKLIEKFHDWPSVSVGYSDHIPPSSMNNDQIIIARTLGAKVIEKHFTDDKAQTGNDHYHAIDKTDLNNISQRLMKLEQALSSDSEEKLLEMQKDAIKHARRGLYYSRAIQRGEVLSHSDLIAKRPSNNFSPKRFSEIIGKKLKTDVEADQSVELGHV